MGDDGGRRRPDGRRTEARRSIWPSIHPRLLELIRAHRSTLIFVNSRRLAERLSSRLNELAGEELVRAHHGSVAREQRLEIEEDAEGRAAARAGGHLQPRAGDRHGRHRPRRPDRGAAVAWRRACSASGGPGTRSASRRSARSSRSTAATCSRRPWSCERMRDGAIEETRIPRNPLDVLAQQIVAICARRALDGRRAARARDAGRAASATCRASSWRACSTCSRAAIRPTSSPSCKPRVVWDRVTDDGRSRATTRGWWRSPAAARSRTAACSASSWPATRAARGRRVGELDEEMVYESRVGEAFLLGASTLADRGDQAATG